MTRRGPRWSPGTRNYEPRRAETPNFEGIAAGQYRNVERRREFIRQWAEYVRTHDDAEWSRRQNVLIDSQLQSANEFARDGSTDPVEFHERMDRRRTRRG